MIRTHVLNRPGLAVRSLEDGWAKKPGERRTIYISVGRAVVRRRGGFDGL